MPPLTAGFQSVVRHTLTVLSGHVLLVLWGYTLATLIEFRGPRILQSLRLQIFVIFNRWIIASTIFFSFKLQSQKISLISYFRDILYHWHIRTWGDDSLFLEPAQWQQRLDGSTPFPKQIKVQIVSGKIL